MSQYGIAETQFTDRDCLVAALAEMGYDKVEVHETAQRRAGKRRRC